MTTIDKDALLRRVQAHLRRDPSEASTWESLNDLERDVAAALQTDDDMRLAYTSTRPGHDPLIDDLMRKNLTINQLRALLREHEFASRDCHGFPICPECLEPRLGPRIAGHKPNCALKAAIG